MKSSFEKKGLAFVVIVLFFGISIVPSIVAENPVLIETIYVDDDNTSGPWDGSQDHPYQHIQDAIDNARDGDTVFVYSGTYYEHVFISKSITLVGENKDNTIIDGRGSGDVVYVSADNVNIIGFTVHDGGGEDGEIVLYSVQNCHIENNTISNNNWKGIYLSHSSNNNIITGNTVSGNWYGIYLSHSSNNTITNNTIRTSEVGIWLDSSSNNNTVTGNTISNSRGVGIDLTHSSNNNIITGNAISNSEVGIYIWDSSNCIITGNNMVENSIFIDGFSLENWNIHTVDTSNTVNGKPVYYWKNISGGTVPLGAGEVILANCTGVTVENQDISDGTAGIELCRSSSCNIINNTISNNNWRGIHLSHSSNNNITGNTISNNEHDGIYLYHSSNNNITGNTISNNNWNGIRLYSTSNNVIKNCNIYSNHHGIYLEESSNSHTKIHYCNIYRNERYGVINEVYNENPKKQYQTDARWCWWGRITGPAHLLNPFGRRDRVSDNVLFRPWLIIPSHYAIINTKSSNVIMDFLFT